MMWAMFGAAAVGLSLGLLGSGGAILTVPILVSLVGHDEKSAIAESLAIVGAIAAAGVVHAAAQKRVDFRSAALLALPGIVGAYLGAEAARHVPGAIQLLLLAALMLAAAVLMFRNGRAGAPRDEARREPLAPMTALWMSAVQGLGLGFTTGLVGVGGGFLIMPVLVLLRRLPMSLAVGTSLAVIAINSAAGLVKYLLVFAEHPDAAARVDWSVVGLFAAVGIVGSLVGNAVSTRMNQDTLKRVFAASLIVVAGYIVVRQAPRVLPGRAEPAATGAMKTGNHAPAARLSGSGGV